MNGAIFDIDGTLLDSVDLHAEAWKQTFEHYGFPQSFGAVRSQIGKGGDQLMPVFLPKHVIDEKGREIEKYRGALFKKNFLPHVKSFPNVRALFEHLLECDWKIALASSAKEEELKIYKGLCEISDLPLAETSSDDVEKSKPHPDIFEVAAKRLGNLKAADCVVVGDSPYDASAAKKCKMKMIGVLCGGFLEESLRQAGCDQIYANPSDLFQKFETSFFGRKNSVY